MGWTIPRHLSHLSCCHGHVAIPPANGDNVVLYVWRRGICLLQSLGSSCLEIKFSHFDLMRKSLSFLSSCNRETNALTFACSVVSSCLSLSVANFFRCCQIWLHKIIDHLCLRTCIMSPGHFDVWQGPRSFPWGFNVIFPLDVVMIFPWSKPFLQVYPFRLSITWSMVVLVGACQ